MVAQFPLGESGHVMPYFGDNLHHLGWLARMGKSEVAQHLPIKETWPIKGKEDEEEGAFGSPHIDGAKVFMSFLQSSLL